MVETSLKSNKDSSINTKIEKVIQRASIIAINIDAS